MELIKDNDVIWNEMQQYSTEVGEALKPIQAELNTYLKEKLSPVLEKYPKFWVALIKQNSTTMEWEIIRSIDSEDFK